MSRPERRFTRSFRRNPFTNLWMRPSCSRGEPFNEITVMSHSHHDQVSMLTPCESKPAPDLSNTTCDDVCATQDESDPARACPMVRTKAVTFDSFRINQIEGASQIDSPR